MQKLLLSEQIAALNYTILYFISDHLLRVLGVATYVLVITNNTTLFIKEEKEEEEEEEEEIHIYKIMYNS